MAVQENQLINAGIQTGLVDANQLPERRKEARRIGGNLIDWLCRYGRFPKTDLYRALADIRGLPFLTRDQIKIDINLINPFNAEILLRRLFIPVYYKDSLYVLLSDPDERMGLDSVQRTLNKPVEVAMADPFLIEAILRQHFSLYQDNTDATALVDDLMKEAYIRKATDIHFEPEEHGMHLRFRVDGQMQRYERPVGKVLSEALVSRIKVLAGMDIAEQNATQDGGFSYQIEEWPGVDEIEMRAAIIPGRWGEKLTLRVLGQDTVGLYLDELGMPAGILENMRQALTKPYGIILVTGPTGSGKSTTLYSALRELNSEQLNILTVEDPVEQMVVGATQVQVTEKVGFAQALRSFLRHDPDVMLVGEIRDHETAETAIRAAMTGHRVLSTLHTNNAISSLSRLEDIGCPRYLVSSTLLGVLAQRLLRRLCDSCCQVYEPEVKERAILKLPADEKIELYRPSGCPKCSGSGYRGRVGIYEALWLNSDLERLIHQGCDEQELMQAAIKAGVLSTLWQDAKTKVLDGVTSVEEIMYLYQGVESNEV